MVSHLARLQGACILTGIGFNGYTTDAAGKPALELWDRVQNIDIWNIETAQSFKVLFDAWNCRANVSRSWNTPSGSSRHVIPNSTFAIGLVTGYRVQTSDATW